MILAIKFATPALAVKLGQSSWKSRFEDFSYENQVDLQLENDDSTDLIYIDDGEQV